MPHTENAIRQVAALRDEVCALKQERSRMRRELRELRLDLEERETRLRVYREDSRRALGMSERGQGDAIATSDRLRAEMAAWGGE